MKKNIWTFIACILLGFVIFITLSISKYSSYSPLAFGLSFFISFFLYYLRYLIEGSEYLETEHQSFYNKHKSSSNLNGTAMVTLIFIKKIMINELKDDKVLWYKKQQLQGISYSLLNFIFFGASPFILWW